MLDNGEVRALDVQVGDKVLFGQYGGSTVKIDGEELLILNRKAKSSACSKANSKH